jgi:hypothetical protein
MWKNGSLQTQPLWKESGSPKKIKHTVPRDLVILLLSLYPRGMRECALAKTCSLMFVAALFILAKKYVCGWRHCPSLVNTQINVMHLYDECCLAIISMDSGYFLQHRETLKT